jgi:hypothetical protein
MTRVGWTEKGDGGEAVRSGSFVGWYPYAAPVTDINQIGDLVGMVIDAFDKGASSDNRAMGCCAPVAIPFVLISIPIDVALDTLLLPIDLVAWSFGLEKTYESKVHGSQEGAH